MRSPWLWWMTGQMSLVHSHPPAVSMPTCPSAKEWGGCWCRVFCVMCRLCLAEVIFVVSRSGSRQLRCCRWIHSPSDRAWRADQTYKLHRFYVFILRNKHTCQCKKLFFNNFLREAQDLAFMCNMYHYMSYICHISKTWQAITKGILSKICVWAGKEHYDAIS